jgi:hypothetical protein
MFMETLYFIRIPDYQERLKALRVFLDVQAERYRYPNNEMAVTKAHIDALEREHIAFEYLYPRNGNDPGTMPVRP